MNKPSDWGELQRLAALSGAVVALMELTDYDHDRDKHDLGAGDEALLGLLLAGVDVVKRAEQRRREAN